MASRQEPQSARRADVDLRGAPRLVAAQSRTRGQSLARPIARLAFDLADHVQRLGFTHVEFLPVMEHPFYGSWGYQTTGYFAPTSRYGTPQDFKFLVDHLHQQGIGVILDWVPSHFPHDEHGLAFFDGTHLYEHADPRQRVQPDWNSYVFNYGRSEVRSFLISSAMYWLEEYHADGLRVDAVASMLYLDYSRQAGRVDSQQVRRPREPRGDRLPAAVQHGRVRAPAATCRRSPRNRRPGRWSRGPSHVGGLGFGLKWDMGWMHDTLAYMSHDPVHRKYHHGQLTFRMIYAFNENFVLPLSHDEVVHGKGSLLAKMPGDEWQKFANLRLLLAYMYGSPGKKLLFMGSRAGAVGRVASRRRAAVALAGRSAAAGIRALADGAQRSRIATSRRCTRWIATRPGFEWIDTNDSDRSVISFLRKVAGRPRADRRGLQLHAGAAVQLSRRRAARRLSGASFSTATPASTAAAATATSAASRRRPCRATGGCTR